MKLAFYCFFIISIVNSFALDEFICKLGGKSINDCVKTAMTENFLKLHNPNKEAIFDTIDPFWFQYGQLVFNGTDKVQGYFALKNLTLVGGKQMKTDKISVKRNQKVLRLTGLMSVPLVYFDGYHESNLKVGEFVVASNGSMNGTFEDVNGKFTIVGELMDIENGLKQLNVSSFDIQIIIKNMHFKINGLAKDEALNLLINRIVNDSWQFLYQDLIQAAKSFWENVVIDLLNELYSFVKFQD